MLPSSTMMAFSGIAAVMDWQIEASFSVPVGASTRARS